MTLLDASAIKEQYKSFFKGREIQHKITGEKLIVEDVIILPENVVDTGENISRWLLNNEFESCAYEEEDLNVYMVIKGSSPKRFIPIEHRDNYLI